MKWETPCEQGFTVVVPYLRAALIQRMVERGVKVKKATKLVGLSATSYEKHQKSIKVKEILSDPVVSDMLESLVGRLVAGDRVEETSFCLLCSNSRKIFGLPPCPVL